MPLEIGIDKPMEKIVPFDTVPEYVRLPNTITEDQRKIWDKSLAELAGYYEANREKLAEEQNRLTEADYYKASEKRVLESGPSSLPQDFAKRAEEYFIYNKQTADTSLEDEAASSISVAEFYNHPERFQNMTTGNSYDDTYDDMSYDNIVDSVLMAKLDNVEVNDKMIQHTKDIAKWFGVELSDDVAREATRTLGDVTEQMRVEVGSTIAGGSAGSTMGPIGTFTGSAAGYTIGRKSALGFDTASINDVGEMFRKDIMDLKNSYPSKPDFKRGAEALVDKYFTPNNGMYWTDIADIYHEGIQNYRDPYIATDLAVGGAVKLFGKAVKFYKKYISPFRAKTVEQGYAKSAQTIEDVAKYKTDKANGSGKVYEGEILGNDVVKLDKESINMDGKPETVAKEYEKTGVDLPNGMHVEMMRDPETGDIVAFGSYKRIGGGVSKGDEEVAKAMRKQNNIESFIPATNEHNFDITPDQTNRILIGTGSDHKQAFGSIKQAEKAVARWVTELPEDTAVAVVEDGPGRYFIAIEHGVDTKRPSIGFNPASLTESPAARRNVPDKKL